MNVNLHITGELERFINGLIGKGLAASKTEAIRLAIARYYEESKLRESEKQADAINRTSMESVWNNQADERSSDFYTKRYLHAKAR